jgi:hypothetical protein
MLLGEQKFFMLNESCVIRFRQSTTRNIASSVVKFVKSNVNLSIRVELLAFATVIFRQLAPACNELLNGEPPLTSLLS